MKNGRLCLPRALIEDTIARPRATFRFTRVTRNMTSSPGATRFTSALQVPPCILWISRSANTANPTWLTCMMPRASWNTCEHIHFFQRVITARDMLTGHDLDINTLYGSIAGTTKHVGTSMVDPAHVEECLKILHLMAGGEDKWRERPFVSQSNCFCGFRR